MNYKKLVSLIPEGKSNAVSSEYLTNLLGLANIRQLKQLVKEARSSGEIILSDCEKGGYYLPANVDEVREFYRWMNKRQITTAKVLRRTRKLLKDADSQIEGQLNFADMENMNV